MTVVWTNSWISEFPLEKARSAAMSRIWLKCRCLLQCIRKKQGGAGSQCNSHTVYQFSAYFKSWNTYSTWNTFVSGNSVTLVCWFCVGVFFLSFKKVNTYVVSVFVICICKAIQLYFPASWLVFCSSAVNREEQTRCSISFILLLRECASCKYLFTCIVGKECGVYTCSKSWHLAYLK